MNSLELNEADTALIRSLIEADVEFAVIGGHAVSAHGFSRPVSDLDILIAPNRENASRIKSAIASVGIPIAVDFESRISQPRANFILPDPFYGQLLGSISGVETSLALQDLAFAPLGVLRVPVISLSILIATKRALGRPQDIADLHGLAGV